MTSLVEVEQPEGSETPDTEGQADAAHARLLELIVSLKLRPGKHVSENVLSRTIGLGRTPVREAIQRLAREGFCSVLPRRGVLIAPLDLQQQREVWQFRMALEPEAARLAAERASREDSERLHAKLNEISGPPQGEQSPDLWAVDAPLHWALALASRNELFIEQLRILYAHARRLWLYQSASRQRPEEEIVLEWTGILDAISAGDGDAASSLMRAHVLASRVYLSMNCSRKLDRGLFDGLTVAVVGGDRRQLEVLAGFKAEGAAVRACGCVPEAEGITLEEQKPTLRDAIADADIIVGPIPVVTDAGALYAPSSGSALMFDLEAFSRAKQGSRFLIGTVTPLLSKLTSAAGMQLLGYGTDPTLIRARVPAVIEGALRVIIENTDFSIHDADALVIGFGHLGTRMARTLHVLGARVTVAARSPAKRHEAMRIPVRAVAINDLGELVSGIRIVVNTVPAPILTSAILAKLPQDAIVVDLADPPGGTDFASAKALGVQAIHARGMGGRAPKTVGRLEWRAIRSIVLELLGMEGADPHPEVLREDRRS